MKHPGFIHDYEIKQLKIKKNKLLRNLQNTATLQDRQTIKDKWKVINKTIQKRVKYAKNERQKKDLLQVNADMKRNLKKAWSILKRFLNQESSSPMQLGGENGMGGARKGRGSQHQIFLLHEVITNHKGKVVTAIVTVADAMSHLSRAVALAAATAVTAFLLTRHLSRRWATPASRAIPWRASVGQLSELYRLLQENQRFHIEFDGYFTNHAAHGLIALYRLGAPAQSLVSYFSSYSTRLEPARACSGPALSRENWQSLLGRRSDFTRLKKFFGQELARLGNDCVRLVRLYYPRLAPGMAAAALHPSLHLGLGLDILDASQDAGRLVVVEGLAYQTFAFLDLSDVTALRTQLGGDPPSCLIAQSTKGEMQGSPLSPLGFIRELLQELGAAGDWVREQAEEARYAKLGLGAFQSKMLVVADNFGGCEGRITRLVSRLLLPSSSKHNGYRDFTALTTALVALVYLTSDNAFFCLHGVTLWFALRKILMHLDDQSWDKTVRAFYLTWASAYLALGTPGANHPWLVQALREGSLLPALRLAQAALAERQRTCLEQARLWQWERLGELGQATTLQQTDEHPAKLVYACRQDAQDIAVREGLCRALGASNSEEVIEGLDALLRLAAASTVSVECQTGSNSSTAKPKPLYRIPHLVDANHTKTMALTAAQRFQKSDVRAWT
eukprot:g44394.t1